MVSMAEKQRQHIYLPCVGGASKRTPSGTFISWTVVDRRCCGWMTKSTTGSYLNGTKDLRLLGSCGFLGGTLRLVGTQEENGSVMLACSPCYRHPHHPGPTTLPGDHPLPPSLPTTPSTCGRYRRRRHAAFQPVVSDVPYPALPCPHLTTKDVPPAGPAYHLFVCYDIAIPYTCFAQLFCARTVELLSPFACGQNGCAFYFSPAPTTNLHTRHISTLQLLPLHSAITYASLAASCSTASAWRGRSILKLHHAHTAYGTTSG